jgi:hypothetical protein
MLQLLDPRFSDELYLAGQSVPSGLYRDTDSGREVHLEQPDYLPASLDGRVAVYTCVEYTWHLYQAGRVDGQTEKGKLQ